MLLYTRDVSVISVKGERNQLMIWGFTEFRTNKKNENMTFLMEILQRLVFWNSVIMDRNLEILSIMAEFQN